MTIVITCFYVRTVLKVSHLLCSKITSIEWFNCVLYKAGFRIRIHFLRIRIRIQRIRMEANTDPDPDPILIQGFNDQKLKKK